MKDFSGAVSCTDGDNSSYQLLRLSVRNESSFSEASPEVLFRINQLEVQIEQMRSYIQNNKPMAQKSKEVVLRLISSKIKKA